RSKPCSPRPARVPSTLTCASITVGRVRDYRPPAPVLYQSKGHCLQRGNAMDAVLGVFAFVGHAIEAVLVYVESHHWIFGFLAGGYIFYLHDRGLHARFDALDKRVDEIRKRLAIEY